MRRMVVAVVCGLALVASTGCVIDLPDGAVPGRTGCQIVWLEPDRIIPPSTDPAPTEPGVDDPRGLAYIFAVILSLAPGVLCSD